jgi:magnesium chelatase family protein
MQSPRVMVETHAGSGLPGTTVVGLPETAVREARDRVKSAIRNSGFKYPEGRVVINLAPADLAKQGARFDLAMAVSVLAATNQLDTTRLNEFEFLGELSLAGSLRPVSGTLCAAIQSRAQRNWFVVPYENAAEAHLLDDCSVLPCRTLTEVVRTVADPEHHPGLTVLPPPAIDPPPGLFGTIVGQQAAKRAIQIGAAGAHHLLMIGPPGTGKTLLARAMPELVPRLEAEVALEIASIYSAAGLVRGDYFRIPFRDPHHSASAPAIVGGGRTPTPGEASLAHGGVLFLDEMPHFAPAVLNLLREPLESRVATIARTAYRAAFPARFQLVGAMNPCPSGRVCDQTTCRCTSAQIQAYQNRIPGPLIDRVDLQFWVPALSADQLTALPVPESITGLVEAVEQARRRQTARQSHLNADLPGIEARRKAPLTQTAHKLLTTAVEGFSLSARSYHKVIKVAWTIADLEPSDVIREVHVAEALSFRAVDWENRLGVG